MRTKTPPIEVVCVQCRRPFMVSHRAYAQRTARYGADLRCAHCITDRWLSVGDGFRTDTLLGEETHSA